MDDSHNVPNTARIPQNEGRERAARERMVGAPLTLSLDQRGIVDRAIRGVCTHCGWTLHELDARTNHVDVVVTAPEDSEPAMNRFKSWATRRLVEAGLVERGRKMWARHGSTIYLWSRNEFEGACVYVRDMQDVERQVVVTKMIRVRSDVRDWDRREG